MFTRNITVRFNECDGLGHVNNGTYFVYMEEARIDLFRIFNPSLQLASWNLIVASARCDFLEQAKFADELTIFTWIGKVGNSSFTAQHAIQNRQGKWIARGEAVLIAYDYQQSRSIPIWGEVKNILAEHAKAPPGAPEFRTRG